MKESSSIALSSFVVEDLGEIEEFVYDIEVDGNHNFFANNIAVHNSCYIDCEDLVAMSKPEDPVDFLDKLAEEVITPVIKSAYGELATRMSSGYNLMNMSREVIAETGLWKAKKNYILNVRNNEGVAYDPPKLKMTGVDAIKSSTPKICKEAMVELFKIIMTGNEKATQDYITAFRARFETFSPDQIGKPTGVTNIKKYADPDTVFKKGAQSHIRAALQYNRWIKHFGVEDKYELIRGGDKFKQIMLKTPNPLGSDIIGFPGKLPDEFELGKYIDFELQFEKVFLNPIKLILDAIGWSSEEVATLEDFFN